LFKTVNSPRDIHTLNPGALLGDKHQALLDRSLITAAEKPQDEEREGAVAVPSSVVSANASDN
jgi:hypothetical protein